MKQLYLVLFLSAGIIYSCSKDNSTNSQPSNTTIDTIPGESNSKVHFIVSDSITEPETIIQFFDETENNPISWHWSFGDHSSSFEQNPLKKYYELGEFTVKLVVEFDDKRDSVEKINYIKVIEKPKADFTANKRLVEAGTSIQFTDKSANGVISWEWDFGDGTTSTEQNPTKIYANDGDYNVSLRVRNEYGWEDSKIQEKFIIVGKLEFIDPRDGQIYGIIQIGNQIWMDRNLNYKTDNAVYYEYNDDYSDYGYLYSDYYFDDPVPEGWHIPSKGEWEELFEFVGGKSIAAGKLKSIGYNYWDNYNSGATDKYGFSAKGGGFYEFGEFDGLKEHAYFLTSSGYWDEFVQVYVSIGFQFRSYSSEVSQYDYLADHYGSKLSIRLIKD